MDAKKKLLLVVAHAPSPNTLKLRQAVEQGAKHEDIENVEVTVLPPLEAGPEDVLAWLEETAQSDAELRRQLDELLVQLQVMQTAEAGLADDDKAWFQQTLRQELQRLGNWERYEAIVIGAGSIAQDHSAAASDFAIAINGNVAHSILAIFPRQSSQAAPEDYEKALERYLRHLLTTRYVLNLRGIRSYHQVSIEVEQAYVTLQALDPVRTEHLLTTHRGRKRSEALQELLAEEKEKPRPLQNLLQKYHRLVVLGDPGSGKTTFLSYLTLSVARTIAEDKPNLLQERLGVQGEAPLPIILPLREFGRYLRHLPESKRIGPQPQLLLDYLNAYYAGWNLNLPPDFFTHHLDSGRCLVMLDGLDEVADFTERVLVSERVEAFVQRYGRGANRFIITCRVRGYEGQAQLGQKFVTATVLPFTDEDISRFAHAWTFAVETSQAKSASESVRQVAAGNARDLLRAIRAHPKVKDLASNPLLLTVIALVHQYRAKLPERRSELYNEATEVLLGYFEAGKPGEESKRLARYTGTALQMDAGEKRAFLEPLALAMHDSELREWDKDRIASLLAQQFHERGHPQQAAREMAEAFLQALTVRSGLIQEVELGVYGFLHLSFQEYLAARKLADNPTYIETTVAHLDDSWWKEVILLEAGHLSESGRSRVSALVKAILEASRDAFQRLLFAGECLVDVGQARTDASLWQRVIEDLLEAMSKQASPEQRAGAGRVLAKLGDPRSGVGLRQQDHLPDIDWVLIPEVDPETGRRAFIYQKNERRTEPDFWISRYPVTYAQFQAFLDAEDGFRNPAWWAGLSASEKHKAGPGTQRFPFRNHPREGVSWYDAIAFCRWLTDRAKENQALLPAELRESGGDWRITLPSEWQWEKAARGFTGRSYPWGPKYISGYANINETWGDAGPYYLQQTSAVGIYPQGKSPFDVLDMSGNVWEWCLNESSNPERTQEGGNARRVLRGGSWFNGQDYASALFRGRGGPHIRDFGFGFRLVVASGSVPI
jgi:formylglycine-generating enzyme required for sulfatase activity